MVVVLEEVAGAGADDVQRVSQDGARLAAAGHRGQLRLVLLVVLELLAQRDRILHICSHSVKSTSKSSCLLRLLEIKFSYDYTYIHGGCVVGVAGRRGAEVGAGEEVLPRRQRAEDMQHV